MEFLDGIAAMPIIVVAVYCIMALYKYFVKGREKAIMLIPILSAFLGAILGVVFNCVFPSLIPASNCFSALLIGGVSGWSATGINQSTKQLIKSIIKPDALALLNAESSSLATSGLNTNDTETDKPDETEADSTKPADSALTADQSVGEKKD